MNGTEKQVAWAEKIAAETLEMVERYADRVIARAETKVQRCIDRGYAKNRIQIRIDQVNLLKLAKSRMMELANSDDAVFIIDNRINFGAVRVFANAERVHDADFDALQEFDYMMCELGAKGDDWAI